MATCIHALTQVVFGEEMNWSSAGGTNTHPQKAGALGNPRVDAGIRHWETRLCTYADHACNFILS